MTDDKSEKWDEFRHPGMRRAPDPPKGSDALGVAQHFLTWYGKEYARIRDRAKSRTGYVMLATSVIAGLVAFGGAVVALEKWSWVGLAMTALGSLALVLTRWDSFWNHRELWLQRSIVLVEIESVRRTMEIDLAMDKAPSDVALLTLRQLDGVLRTNLAQWLNTKEGRGPKPELG